MQKDSFIRPLGRSLVLLGAAPFFFVSSCFYFESESLSPLFVDNCARLPWRPCCTLVLFVDQLVLFIGQHWFYNVTTVPLLHADMHCA